MAVNPRRRRSSAPVGITPYGAGGFGARTRTAPRSAPQPIPTPGPGKGGSIFGKPGLIPIPQPLQPGPAPEPIQMQPMPEMPQAPVTPPQAPVAGPAPAPTPPAPINDAQMPVGGYQLPNPAPTPPVSDGNFGRVQPMPEPISPIAMPTPNPVPAAPPANVPAPDQPSTQMPVQAPVEMPVAPTPAPEQPLQSVGGAGGPPQSNPAFIDSIRDQIQNPDRVTGGPAMVAPPLTGGTQQLQDEYNRQRRQAGMLTVLRPPGEFAGGYDNWLKQQQESAYDPMQNFDYFKSSQYSPGDAAGINTSDPRYIAAQEEYRQQQASNPNVPKTMYDYYNSREPAPVPQPGPGKGGVGGPFIEAKVGGGSGAGGFMGFQPPQQIDSGTGGVGGFNPIDYPPLPGPAVWAPIQLPQQIDSGTGSPPVMGGGMMMPGSLGDQITAQNQFFTDTIAPGYTPQDYYNQYTNTMFGGTGESALNTGVAGATNLYNQSNPNFSGMGGLTSGALQDPNAPPLDQYGNPIVAPGDIAGSWAQAFR